MPSLEEIAAQVTSCTKCALHTGRTHAVPGEGSAHAEIMFIGEGPGRMEDEQGRPFVGPAGKLLTELLASIGIKREDVYITNVVKCRPPGNRDPEPEEITACFPYLISQINLIKPKLIIPLGRHAMTTFLPGLKISAAHGKPYRRTVAGIGKYVFYPSYHPAASLHQPSLKQDLLADFKRLPAVIKKVDELLSAPDNHEENISFTPPTEPQSKQKTLF